MTVFVRPKTESLFSAAAGESRSKPRLFVGEDCAESGVARSGFPLIGTLAIGHAAEALFWVFDMTPFRMALGA